MTDTIPEIPYCYFDAAGRITLSGASTHANLDAPLERPGETLLVGQSGDFDTDYVRADPNGEPAVYPRPAMAVAVSTAEIVADGVDAAYLFDLPLPCTIYVDDGLADTADALPVTVTQADLEPVPDGSGAVGWAFAASDPGVYTLTITRFPLLPATVTITATAP